MNRRHALGGLIGGATSALAQSSLPALRKTGEKPRNVIFVLTDDHRYDAMGFLKGQDWLETPQMDRLAREGVYFQIGRASCRDRV